MAEDCDYSSQRHFNTAAFFRVLHYSLGCAVAILGSIGGAALVLPASVSVLTGGVASIGAAALAGVTTTLSPSETATRHYRAGNEYLGLRKETKAFMELDMRQPDAANPTLEPRVRKLVERGILLDKTYGDLYTPEWAYTKAREDIRRGHTRHHVDRREISAAADESTRP